MMIFLESSQSFWDIRITYLFISRAELNIDSFLYNFLKNINASTLNMPAFLALCPSLQCALNPDRIIDILQPQSSCGLSSLRAHLQAVSSVKAAAMTYTSYSANVSIVLGAVCKMNARILQVKPQGQRFFLTSTQNTSAAFYR